MARDPKEQVWAKSAQYYWRYNQISIAHAHNRSRDLSYKIIMVPKQCPLLRSTFWYLICCATCFGSRDNSKYRTYPLTEPPTNLRPIHTWPRSDFHRLFDSGFAPSALSIPLNSWWHAWHDSVGAMPFAVFANCPSSELRVGCCQYSRAFLLWALFILAVSRAARWLEVAPRWHGA